MKAFEQDYSMANDVIDGPMTVEISNGAATYVDQTGRNKGRCMAMRKPT